jgi:hypothetical protein
LGEDLAQEETHPALAGGFHPLACEGAGEDRLTENLKGMSAEEIASDLAAAGKEPDA